jgi:uncharacterized protein YjbI with pentapeptide repeats
MIQAKPAPVKPRVFSDRSGEILALEDEIGRLIADGARGLVAVLGPAGSGKTTAIQHLAAVLPQDDRLLLFDDDVEAAIRSGVAFIRLAVYTAHAERKEPHLAVFRLASWERDDLIEYLLAVYPPSLCKAVMSRVHDSDCELLGGVPELWRHVLDRLQADDTIPDVRRALHRHLESHLVDTDLLERTRSACLNAVVAPDANLAQTLTKLARPGFAESLVRLLRHPASQLLLAAERVASELHGDGDCDFLAKRLPRELVRAAAALVAKDERALEHLQRLLAGPKWSHAMSVSLLHAAGTGWVPTPEYTPSLAGAYLDGACWPAVDLHGADLTLTDLSGADLAGANLHEATTSGTNFHSARLRAADLGGLLALQANLSNADLSDVRGNRALFPSACLQGANLDGAVLRETSFCDADLTGASFREADLFHARFVRDDGTSPDFVSAEPGRAAAGSACLERADFTCADLTEAVLLGLPLRVATWTGARFTRARLIRCDLEGLTLPDVDFAGAYLSGALLTGTVMPGANFQHADLRNTGLAEIEWEGADLRDADLRGATFHMGSSRSGLVGSPIACEGSRTGFYTDDYEEQTFKSPEEIRKANLCGTDLRGAKIEGVDFYLVDLRGATLDADQEEHVRGCGAILGTRV